MKKYIVVLASVLGAFAVLFFLLRGPYLSNSIKRAILPVLEDATGKRLIIDKAVINLLPFYLQTKGVKVFDSNGNRIAKIAKIRAYISPLGLLSGEIRIQRLLFIEPDVTISPELLRDLEGAGGDYRGNERYSVSVKSARIMDGRFFISGTNGKADISGEGLFADVVARDEPYVRVLVKNCALKVPGLPVVKGKFEGEAFLSGATVRIVEAKVLASGSVLEVKGDVSAPGRQGHIGTLTGRAKVFAGTVAEMFGLKESRDGELSFSGKVDVFIPDGPDTAGGEKKFRIDVRTQGWFYLQTLMETLQLSENIGGRVSIDGTVHGIYPHITGQGVAEAENLVLDTLVIDDVKGDLTYKDRRFGLSGFLAHALGGTVSGTASLVVPGGHYHVEADATGMNSMKFFRFISWEPPFTEGKVGGRFTVDKEPGKDVEVVAQATYSNTTKNVANRLQDRLRSMRTGIDLKGGILTLNDAVLSTAMSDFFLDGTVDLHGEKLALSLVLEGRDAADLTAPFYERLKAPVHFKGRAEGTFRSPQITGTVELSRGTLNGEPFERASGDLVYDPGALSVRSLRIGQGSSVYEAQGSVVFRKSKGLFSFDDPFYSAEAKIRDGDASSLIGAVYRKLPIEGSVSGRLFFKGDTKEFEGHGDAELKDGEIYGQRIDRASITTELTKERIRFSSVEIVSNKSRCTARGSLFFDGRFDLSVSSDGVDLGDLYVFRKYPVAARFDLEMQGSGSWEDPVVTFSSNVLESHVENAGIGKGRIEGVLKDKKLSIRGSLLDGKATVDAGAFFSKDLPWSVDVVLKRGSYNFLISGYLKEVPRDLLTTLEGQIRVRGERGKYSMKTTLSSLNVGLYGYTFINRGDIVVELVDGELRIRSFSVRGLNGDMTVSGVVEMGKKYDLAVDGRISLTPLKVLTRDVQSLKGDGMFSVSVSGPWESPDIQGEIKVRDTSVMHADFPYMLGPMQGDVFFDKERVTFDSFRAEFAGGNVLLSGVGHVKGLSMKRVSLAAVLEGIRFRPEKDIDILLDGELFFDSSKEKQSLLGNVNIRRARYSKRVEWKSELLELEPVQKGLAERSSFMDRTELNVFIEGKENIVIDNNIARSPVTVDLNIQGTPAQYGIMGRIGAKGGMIFFRGNEFEVIEGSVDFVEADRVAPVFHIQSETSVKGYRVKLNLDGPPEGFAIALFSDPPLTNFEIMSLLTSGQITRGTEGFAGGIGAGEATAFLTGKFQDILEERFQYITGFERFEIDPHTTSAGGVSPRVTVGKRLLGDKLSVTYSSSIGSTELDAVRVKYDINRNVSVIGSRDEIGSIGADVRYRFEFK